MSKTFVIAEAAATHDGDREKMSRLITLVAEIGAAAIKFQWVSRAERLCERRHAPDYLEAYRLLEFDPALHWRLAEQSQKYGLEYLCTVYIPEDIAVIARYVTRFKVSSFEATDAHFVALHAEWPTKPLIISAGMGADPSRAIRAYYSGILSCDSQRKAVAVLHCVSAYPCPDDQIGLAALRERPMRSSPLATGLSDHTRHPWTGALAVAAGAQIIEFHVRLDDTDPGNADYAVSRSPKEALAYVANIRTAEAMLGDGVGCVMPAEQEYLRYRVRPDA